jgi:hypothetical protein
MKLKHLVLVALLFPTGLLAQKGHYIGLAFGPQMVGMANAEDVRTFNSNDVPLGVSRNPTYRWAAGLDYYYNFAECYGVQTGVYFTRLGQNYSGHINKDANTGKDGDILYDSHIYMDYLRIPLMFRFSSLMEEDDRMNLTIYTGISFNYFLGVTDVATSPSWPDSMAAKYPDFDYNKLYYKTNIMLGAGAQFNIKANKTLYPFFGIRFDRSLSTVENLGSLKGMTFGKGGPPAEWTFPVSTKKSLSTDLLTRTSSKHNVINLYVGLALKLNRDKND